jgi:hypothetical protein
MPADVGAQAERSECHASVCTLEIRVLAAQSRAGEELKRITGEQTKSHDLFDDLPDGMRHANAQTTSATADKGMIFRQRITWRRSSARRRDGYVNEQ